MKSNLDTFPTRFKQHLPLVASLVLNPWISLGFAIVLALPLAAFSIHYALSLMIIWTAILSFSLERGTLDRILLPPFSVVIAWEAMGLGVGASLIALQAKGEVDPGTLKMQIVYLLMFPIMYGAFRLGHGPVRKMILPDKNPQFESEVIRPLVTVGWIMFSWRVIQLTVFAATGAEDRGDFSMVAQDQYFGIATYFNLFPRLSTLGFFLLPLVFSRTQVFGKWILAGLMTYYMVLAFAAGARGNVFFPILFIMVGLFFFRVLRSIKIDISAIVVSIAIFPLVIFMDHFRNTEAYKASRTIDLKNRLSAITEAKSRSSEASSTGEEGANTLLLGRALVGVMDATVYEMTPSPIPHAGAENFSGVLYTWVPFFLYRDRPILYDANAILIDYTGGVFTRTGKAITLPADLYRRFGWFAIPFGVAVAFWVYGRFCGWCYRIYFEKNALLGILLLLFTFSFFQARPFSTVLTTWWIFFYEIPKHLVLLYAGYWLLKNTGHVTRVRGALTYLKKG
jgi:hypothetical protein